MSFIISEVKSNKDRLDFISLPDKLYDKKYNTQNKNIEKQILNGTHPLSKDFSITAYIVREDNEVVTRGILTIYPNDDTGYIGFFESINNEYTVKLLINAIKNKCRKLGLSCLVGPVDCSFWIKYRFKVDNFNNIYTGEPYNLSYYKSLWEKSGFTTYERYYSNQLRIPTKLDINTKCKDRLNRVSNQGIKIRNTSIFSFKSDLNEIYNLLIKLYSKFPIYKHIKKEQFKKMFSYMQFVLDYRMVFVAYKNKQLAGFMICIPNYNKNNIIDNIRHKHSEYSITYLGVDNGFYGLGGALSELCKEFLEKHKCTSIMALIHKGNTSGVFYKELSVNKYNYILMKLDLKE